MYRFATRVGRRLLKNKIFVNKLLTQLNDDAFSDSSEKKEGRWGLEEDNGISDLKGYKEKQWLENELDDDVSSTTEYDVGE